MRTIDWSMYIFNFQNQSFESSTWRTYAFAKHLVIFKTTLAIYLTPNLKAFTKYALEWHIYKWHIFIAFVLITGCLCGPNSRSSFVSVETAINGKERLECVLHKPWCFVWVCCSRWICLIVWAETMWMCEWSRLGWIFLIKASCRDENFFACKSYIIK